MYMYMYMYVYVCIFFIILPVYLALLDVVALFVFTLLISSKGITQLRHTILYFTDRISQRCATCGFSQFVRFVTVKISRLE